MKSSKILAVGLAALSWCAFDNSAQSTVIDSADVGGLRTFQDTATNRTWLDLDNFRDLSISQMISAANSTGFTWATRNDLNELWASLPLGSGEWAGYASIMGRTTIFPAIVGVFDDGGSTLRATQGFSWITYSAWQTDLPDFTLIEAIPTPGSFQGQWNLWAFRENSAAVPAPGALALLGLGLLSIGGLRRDLKSA